jgi:hypothetical protein
VAQVKDLGSPLWWAEFSSVPVALEVADAAIADFRTLGGALQPFYLVPPTRRRPASIASDSPLGGVTVMLAEIRSDNRGIRLAGLPSGFVLTKGDYLSIRTTSTAREFLQLATGGVADVAGLTPELEVVPWLRPSVAVGQVVDLLDPSIEMVLDPGTLDDPYSGLSHRTIQFKAVQVIR